MPDRLMTATEFVERAEILFGKNWRKPLGRIIDRSPRMVRFYAAGEFSVPAGIARKLRCMTDIGETGAIIREAIRRAVPALRPYDANSAAKEALAALTTAGVLPGTAPAPCEFLCNHASRPEHST